MKRVLFVIETLYGGGAERVLSNLTTHFPEEWHIDILLNDKSLVGYPYRGNILSLSRPEKKSVVYFIRNIIVRTYYLNKLKRENGYDACVSFLDSANISNVLSGKRHCRTIVSIHTDIVGKGASLYSKVVSKPLAKFLFRNADKIITVSEELEWEMIHRLKMPGNRIRTIVNGCDCEWIKKMMKNIPQTGMKVGGSFMANKKIIVTVGRLNVCKGQWHLVRAFMDVVREEPAAVLFIVGDGELKSYMASLIKACNLEKNVVLIGYTDNPFWYLSKADVFVLPSLYEGYPNVLAEAVCCGIACIATDVHSGSREILAPQLSIVGERVRDISEEEFGVLVPVCSGKMYKGNETLEPAEQKMARAITGLLHNDKKREHYRQMSIKRSMDLGMQDIVNQWIDVIMGKDI